MYAHAYAYAYAPWIPVFCANRKSLRHKQRSFTKNQSYKVSTDWNSFNSPAIKVFVKWVNLNVCKQRFSILSANAFYTICCDTFISKNFHFNRQPLVYKFEFWMTTYFYAEVSVKWISIQKSELVEILLNPINSFIKYYKRVGLNIRSINQKRTP